MNKQAFKILLSLAFIIVGTIIGSFIKWDKGSAALIGAIAGLLLYALANWLLSLYRKGWRSERHAWRQTDIGDQRQVDPVAKRVQNALEEDQMRHPPTFYSGGPI